MKRIIFDIETGPLPIEQLEKVMPEFTEPKTKGAKSAAEKRQEWIDDAALCATTGKVLAIGLFADSVFIPIVDDEAKVLADFWTRYFHERHYSQFIGFNIFGFDLPFLIRRSWILGIEIPELFQGSSRRYWSEHFTDLADIWRCNGKDHVSLDTLCKTFGVGCKNGHGADFHRLLATDQKKAMEYLENDLRITAALAERMLGKSS